jgi:hypothetical protein
MNLIGERKARARSDVADIAPLITTDDFCKRLISKAQRSIFYISKDFARKLSLPAEALAISNA